MSLPGFFLLQLSGSPFHIIITFLFRPCPCLADIRVQYFPFLLGFRATKIKSIGICFNPISLPYTFPFYLCSVCISQFMVDEVLGVHSNSFICR